MLFVTLLFSLILGFYDNVRCVCVCRCTRHLSGVIRTSFFLTDSALSITMFDNLVANLHSADRDPLGYAIRTYLTRRVLIYLFSAAIRIALILYSNFHDDTFEVKFTDVDYHVFTDAARLLLNGESVYHRHTYRYTPLLALILVPNVVIHRSFGKFLFATVDLLTGYMLERSVESSRTLVQCMWLLNPFVIGISARGNADCIICFLVVATLYFLRKDRIVLSAFAYGLAVHFKLYPVIYALPLFLYLSTSEVKSQKSTEASLKDRLRSLFSFINLKLLRFAVVSAALFFSTSFLSYYFYGFDFLDETYLYHYIRKDHRHNFSIFFNYMYHIVDSGREINSIISFIPQLACLVGYGLLGHWDLELAIFLQTISFVSLNKVCTCQYYLWWMCLLPLVFAKLSFGRAAVIVQGIAIGGFVLSNAVWLFFAYKLEMLGYNTYNMLLWSSVLFVATQMAIGWVLLKQRVSTPVQKPSSE